MNGAPGHFLVNHFPYCRCNRNHYWCYLKIRSGNNIPATENNNAKKDEDD